ncbi:MAG TPA: hypothetical protein VFQ61_18085 [Polyangiaceae bacterium]|nr:hypothetical protein [Polyangiaceae bacterium]
MLKRIALSCVISGAALACSARPPAPPPSGELSPGVVFPTALGEGHGDEDEPATAASGSASAPSGPAPGPTPAAAAPAPSASGTLAAPPKLGFAPDPEPLRLSTQWEYELEWRDSRIQILSNELKKLPQPIVTPRRFGRFAAELWIGRELIDRVRFDFPLLAGEAPQSSTGTQPLFPTPDLSKGATTRVKIMLPASPRAVKMKIVDRATGATLEFPFPPPTSPPANP